MRIKKIHSILITILLLLVGNQMGFSHSEVLCSKKINHSYYKSFVNQPHYTELNTSVNHDTLFESFSERENTNSNGEQPSLLHIANIAPHHFGIQIIGYVISIQNFPTTILLKINTFRYLFLRNLRL